MFAIYWTISVLVLAFPASPQKFHRILFRNVAFNKTGLNSTLWTNDGYKETNATQISHSLKNGQKLHSSAHFLMGTADAKLRTILQNFSSNLLSIKFSSMIGKSTEANTENSAAGLQVTTVIEKNKTILDIKTKTVPVPVTATIKTTKLLVPVSVTGDIPNPTDPPAKRKKRKQQVIHIALDTPDAENGNALNQQPGAFMEPEQEQQPPSPPHIIIEQQSSSKRRKRRNTNDEGVPINDIDHSLNDSPTTEILQPTLSNPVSVAAKKPKPTKPISFPQSVERRHSLQYKTWKASLSQDFRPPGFYVLVDDYILFDNWEGVWFRQEPNVLGKYVKSTASDIWSHTELLIEWEEPPKRDVKVRFEWTPGSSSNFVFLKDIQISTFSAPSTDYHPPAYDPSTKTNPNNITLNFVFKFKPPTSSKEIDVILTDENGSAATSPLKSKTIIATPKTTSTSTSTSTTSTTKSPIKYHNSITSPTTTSTPATTTTTTTTTPPKPTLGSVNLKLSHSRSVNIDNSQVFRDWSIPLIVSIVMGCVCFLILVSALYVKSTENSRNSRNSTSCCNS